MLRVDNNAQLVCMPFTLGGLVHGRYAVAAGERVFEGRWRRRRLERLAAQQEDQPVALVAEGRRLLWWFDDRFYWADDDLAAEDVAALVFQREGRRRRTLANAHSVMRAQAANRSVRAPIPSELRRAVFERDGGACVQCGASFDLQYDHVLPVALGGATTLLNLQLLCADCNRAKGDSL